MTCTEGCCRVLAHALTDIPPNKRRRSVEAERRPFTSAVGKTHPQEHQRSDGEAVMRDRVRLRDRSKRHPKSVSIAPPLGGTRDECLRRGAPYGLCELGESDPGHSLILCWG